MWSVESGRLVLRLSHTHDASELTALSLDATGRRLLTGSRQGDIKVWGYREGVCLKHMSGFSSTEVTGVKHLRDKSRFLAVGWNRRITTFPDDPDVSLGPYTYMHSVCLRSVCLILTLCMYMYVLC